MSGQICNHCHQPIEIRNPSGYCDHLYYPDCCEVCKEPGEREELARLKSKYEPRTEG